MERSKIFFRVLCIVLITSFVVSCKSKDGQSSKADTTLLVQLYDDNAVAELEKEYRHFSLEKEKVVSLPMHIYLFRFNTKKVNDTTLIKLLKESSLVKEAQTNKDVITRKN